MEQKQLWGKVSGSINFFIKGVWREQLLKSNEDLLNDFIHYSLIEGKSKDYQYLDKKTFEYISIDNETLERIKTAFLERIEKKKLKYADEIQELNLELDKTNDRSSANVVDFFKYKR
ncbi:hypothetical protein GKZ28_25210 [Clostridium chromiireducens]|uniref:Uncharacterized protein n=1 Tax=Clostridium chromiireducens TaxID=225345 RepID=A0A964RSF2_9CLOT|nr:hypothetical protein [Clostridium chromiireducens]MVX66960.1 hypothetical protein [Clostridium chromiireducens]